MIKVGDFVTRKKYNHDIIFKVDKIENNNVILKGIDLRLIADAKLDDLVLKAISKKKEVCEIIRNIDKSKYFYIPGKILHLDSDSDYLNKCLEYYKSNNIPCFGYIYKESQYESEIIKLIEKHNPDFVVITGHDAYHKNDNTYVNSAYFINCVKKIRKKYTTHDSLYIFAGACQSNFEDLIKAGATYASSPQRINIHALDPAKIASYVVLMEKSKLIDLDDVLNKTKYGPNGIGGIITTGLMLSGYPRKE